MSNDKLVWLELNLADLSKEARNLFAEGDAASKLAREKRSAAEAEVIKTARKVEAITKDQTLLFSYNFGKKSIAVVEEADRIKPKSKAKTFNLSGK